MQQNTEEQVKKSSSLFEWAQILCAALIVITLLYTFVGRLINVKGHSMENTLTNGEQLLLSGRPYKPERGDIVVVSRGTEIEPLIKRVIGLPGDAIRIDEESGTVFLNDTVLDEPYIIGKTATEGMIAEITVPEGQLFVMGDNRAPGGSLDSRILGCVSQSDVVGKAVYRIMPFQRMGGLYGD